MISESEDTDAHWHQDIPIEWHAVELTDGKYIIRDQPEGTVEIFRHVGNSKNVRVLAQADRVVYDGVVTAPDYDQSLRCVRFVHDFAGGIDRKSVAEWLDEPAVMLETVPTTEPSVLEVTA